MKFSLNFENISKNSQREQAPLGAFLKKCRFHIKALGLLIDADRENSQNQGKNASTAPLDASNGARFNLLPDFRDRH